MTILVTVIIFSFFQVSG